MSRNYFTQISSFCDTGSGTTPSRQKADRYYGGSIPWVKSGELRETEISKTEECVTELALKETSLHLVPAGAILVAMYGATVGRVGRLGVCATTNQAVCHIVPDPARADGSYLFHALCAKSSELIAKGVGGAQPNINQSTIKNLEMYIPPLPEQKRIAAILDQADELRRKRQRAIDRLNQLGQAIFFEMFGDSSATQFSLSKLGKVLTGNTPPTDDKTSFGGSIPFITPGDLGSHCFAKRTLSESGLVKSRTVRAGATLVCCIGATIGKMDIATQFAAFNQQINAVEWGPKVHPIFGFYAMKQLRETIIHKGKGASTTLPILKKSEFEKLMIPVPEFQKQNIFGARIESIVNNSTRFKLANDISDQLFQSLQHRAFTGTL